VYLAIILLLMLVLPAASVLADYAHTPEPALLMPLVGKWFVFWGVGIRLGLAGLRQFFQPRFTAAEIFGIAGDEALPLIRELGIANFSLGVVGVASLAAPSFVLPTAIAAAIFYGVAGFRHLARKAGNRNENIAMVSDLFAFVVLAAFILSVWAA
jgi:hypothetical protein